MPVRPSILPSIGTSGKKAILQAYGLFDSGMLSH
jgi:hypothetical protein